MRFLFWPVIGLLACVLGGYAYATAPEKKTLSARTEQKAERPALDFTPERVTQIDLQFDGQHLVDRKSVV